VLKQVSGAEEDVLVQALDEMWERRIEFHLLGPVSHVFRNSHPAMKEMEVPQVPAWAEANKPRVMDFLSSRIEIPPDKTWIVDTARRFYQDRSRAFPAQMRAACAQLGCVSDEDIVTKVAKQCTRAPGQTLELAVQRSLRDIISPAIGCDARCAMRLGAQ